jgi:hypothetical protein
VLDAHDGVELTTAPADALLSLLVGEDPAHRRVPPAVLSIAAEVRNQGRAGRSAPPSHVPTSSGWLTLTDTRSRRELLSQVFFHDQLPGIVAHDPLNAGGHLQEPSPS